jgi:RND family efflux transporter MFP subunit
MPTRTRRLRVAVPVALLALALVGRWVLVETRPPVEKETRERSAPRVRVLPVEPTTVRLDVSTHGTVRPRMESDLIPQVSGPVVNVSPQLVSGGFFRVGDVLLEVDDRDYQASLDRARAARVRAQSEYERAAKELERRRGLSDRGVASASQMDDARNAEQVRSAALREARSAVETAERDLERTRVRAPFDGRVREESVGVGQFVTRGSPIAKLYATDYVEVRLPIPDRQLAFIDLPLAGTAGAAARPVVHLHARFAGAEHVWTGTIERTEGEIDPQSRMVHVVARVESPYEPDGVPGRPPLAVGLFVRAEIEGRQVAGAVLLPRSAIHGGDRVWIVDAEGRLRERTVQVVRSVQDEVVVSGGLRSGERVVVSPLEAAVEGMIVETLSAPAEVRS